MDWIFLWSAPVAFRRVALETPEWTSRDSNHHRQSVSAGKTNAIPTEPSGRLIKMDWIAAANGSPECVASSYADEHARHTAGIPTASQVPDTESAFRAVQNALSKLETRIIEFLVTLLVPAKHVLDARSPQ